jgi:hypothetical protein
LNCSGVIETVDAHGALVGFAAVQLIGALALRGYDDRKMREELQQLPRNTLTRFIISQAGVDYAITNQAEISAVVALVQSLAPVAAHHSYPIEVCEITFERDGKRFRYSMGRDSAAAGEYWIMDKARSGGGNTGRELGRVHSNQREPLIERLTNAGRTAPKYRPGPTLLYHEAIDSSQWGRTIAQKSLSFVTSKIRDADRSPPN